jgi:nucleoside-diphosphate-sugar epimerase
MRILITGSSGFVGRHLHPRLQEDGHEVIALRRGTGSPDGPGTVDGPSDIADIESWKGWPGGVEAVVHLAALNPARGDRNASDLKALRRANGDATAALARRAVNEGVGRIVFASTAHVHAPRGNRSIAETDPLAPVSPYAVSKGEAEAALWKALAGSGTEGCVLRPAPVYGRGARGGIGTLVALARGPAPLPLGGFGAPRSLVAADHLCAAIGACLDHPAAAGETFLVADDGPLTPAGIVAALRQGWKRRPLILPAPARLMAWAAERSGSGERWRQLATPSVIDTGHIRQLLGWRPATSTAETLRGMAAAGLI